ncbi:MAG: M20 family metallopeptidase [Candidatus Nanohaloarchaea archaeon]|nr:M20 family metallopeptidase [Candidatus Nanohaloarchaea archaeon]
MGEDVESLVKDLVAINSVSGNEEELANYLHDYLEAQGVETINQDGNVVVELKNGSDKALHFNAHMDTVDADPDKWEYSPWSPTVEDGRIYGLGASDVKGSIAALIKAIEDLKDRELDLDLYFAFVKKEEIDGSGTEAFMDYYIEEGLNEKYSNQACVLTEPTGLEAIEIGCKGLVFLEITTQGESAHGSRPSKGDNATLRMLEVVEKLKELKNEFKDYQHPLLGEPTISIATTIESGGSINKLPSSCRMTCDIRTVPGMHDQVMELVEEKAGHLAEIETTGRPVPPVLTPEDEEICTVAKKAAGVEFTTATGSDDSIFYSKNGINTVVLGPGEKKAIHRPDEYIETKKVEDAVDNYIKIAEHFSEIEVGEE